MKKFLATTLHTLFILLLVAVAGLFLAPLVPIPGNIELKIVKSGSMEPAIRTGGIIVIKPASTYNVGDIITFGEDSPDTYPTTHRIVSINQADGRISYMVKGDANEEQDPNPVYANDIIGKVLFTVPAVGYVLDFARQPIGFILLIGLPAALVILNEIIDIGKEIQKVIRRRKKNKIEQVFKRLYQMDDVLRPVYSVYPGITRERVRIPLIMGILVLFGISFVSVGFGNTVSYFSDNDGSLGNTMSAISLEIFALATPEESYVGATGGSFITSTVNMSPDNLPHEYRVTVEKKDGSDIFCQALQMNSTETPPFVYQGPILNFVSLPATFSGDWQFEVSLLSAVGVNEDDICVIDLVYTANTWLEDEGIYGGYSDVEKVTLTFEADAHDYVPEELTLPIEIETVETEVETGVEIEVEIVETVEVEEIVEIAEEPVAEVEEPAGDPVVEEVLIIEEGV